MSLSDYQHELVERYAGVASSNLAWGICFKIDEN